MNRLFRSVMFSLGSFLLVMTHGCGGGGGSSNDPNERLQPTQSEDWTIQLDDTNGAIPGRIWITARATIREDKAQGACKDGNGTTTVTTILADFSLLPGRVNTSTATGGAVGSSTNGSGNCDTFSMTLSPQGEADIVITGPGPLVDLEALFHDQYGTGFLPSREAQPWKTALWSWGSRKGVAYVYRARLSYLPDSHYDLQLEFDDSHGAGAGAIVETWHAGGYIGPPDFDFYTRAAVVYVPRRMEKYDDDVLLNVIRSDQTVDGAGAWCKRKFDGPDQVHAVVYSTDDGSIKSQCSTGLSTYEFGFEAKPVSSTEIDLQWDDFNYREVSTLLGVSEVQIARKTDQSAYVTVATFTDDRRYSYNDTDLPPGTTYTYSLTLRDPAGKTAGAFLTATTLSSGSIPVVDVSASVPVVPGNGVVPLTCAARNGVGPFDYAWRGYRGDGAPGPTGPLALSSTTTSLTNAQLFFPTQDFHFFCTATDLGVPETDPNRTTTGYVKVSESDGPVGRFTVGAGPLYFGDLMSFDASASTGVVGRVSWTIEQWSGHQTLEPGLEGYLKLFSSDTTGWQQIYTTSTGTLSVTVPASTFPAPGIYRARLDVFNAYFDAHTSYQYFTILP